MMGILPWWGSPGRLVRWLAFSWAGCAPPVCCYHYGAQAHRRGRIIVLPWAGGVVYLHPAFERSGHLRAAHGTGRGCRQTPPYQAPRRRNARTSLSVSRNQIHSSAHLCIDVRGRRLRTQAAHSPLTLWDANRAMTDSVG